MSSDVEPTKHLNSGRQFILIIDEEAGILRRSQYEATGEGFWS